VEHEIIDKAIFEDKSLLQVYIYLRSQAKYKPTEKLIDNKTVILQPGQLTLGSRQLASIIGTSPTTAHRLLKKLEKLGEITVTPFKSCSLITLNYWPTEKQKSETPSNPTATSDTAEILPVDETQTKHKRNTNKTQMKTPIDSNNVEGKKKENIYSPVIAYLNQKAGTSYKPTTKKNKELIDARVNEGATLEDFKTVIDKKTTEWKGTEYEQYLRPVTLFGTKFEGYLNQPAKKPKGGSGIGKDEAKSKYANAYNRPIDPETF